MTGEEDVSDVINPIIEVGLPGVKSRQVREEGLITTVGGGGTRTYHGSVWLLASNVKN